MTKKVCVVSDSEGLYAVYSSKEKAKKDLMKDFNKTQKDYGEPLIKSFSEMSDMYDLEEVNYYG